MVREKAQGGLEVVFVDLANTQIVDENLSGLEKWRKRRTHDEEGAICQIMAVKLRNEHGCKLKWAETNRYIECDVEGEDDTMKWAAMIGDVWRLGDRRRAPFVVAETVARSRQWSAIMGEEMMRSARDEAATDWPDRARSRIRALEESGGPPYHGDWVSAEHNMLPGEPFFAWAPYSEDSPWYKSPHVTITAGAKTGQGDEDKDPNLEE